VSAERTCKVLKGKRGDPGEPIILFRGRTDVKKRRKKPKRNRWRPPSKRTSKKVNWYSQYCTGGILYSETDLWGETQDKVEGKNRVKEENRRKKKRTKCTLIE